MILEDTGYEFAVKPLLKEAHYAAVYTIACADVNKDCNQGW